LGENVTVFGTFGAASGFAASQLFLRPSNVLGNFRALQAAGSDDTTGAFTTIPCGPLFGGQAITVLTSSGTRFDGVGGLTALSAAPTLNTVGVFFYQPTSGTATTGGSWLAPTWVMQAREVDQSPN
jgi:hypothetical protein